ncbi:MAG: hypothetical protein ACRD3Q_18935, partial [Terriglobales bacterium]
SGDSLPVLIVYSVPDRERRASKIVGFAQKNEVEISRNGKYQGDGNKSGQLRSPVERSEGRNESSYDIITALCIPVRNYGRIVG